MYAFRRRSTLYRSSTSSFKRKRTHDDNSAAEALFKPSDRAASSASYDPYLLWWNGANKPNVNGTNANSNDLLDTQTGTEKEDEPEMDNVSRKSVIADIVEISLKNCRMRSDVEQGLRPLMYPISGALKVVLLFMRILGFFPGFLRCRRRRKLPIKWILVGYLVLSLLVPFPGTPHPSRPLRHHILAELLFPPREHEADLQIPSKVRPHARHYRIDRDHGGEAVDKCGECGDLRRAL